MSWLKDCEICNTGLCKTVDAKKESGLSERAACREMSGESEGLYSEDAILNRYRYHTGKKKVYHFDTDKKRPEWVINTMICFCEYVNLKREEVGNWRDAFRIVSEESYLNIRTLLDWHTEVFGEVWI